MPCTVNRTGILTIDFQEQANLRTESPASPFLYHILWTIHIQFPRYKIRNTKHKDFYIRPGHETSLLLCLYVSIGAALEELHALSPAIIDCNQ